MTECEMRRMSNETPTTDKPAAPPQRTPGVIGVVILTLIVLFIAAKVGHAFAMRSHPPAMCYLIGGHWDMWNGWNCG